MNDCENTTPFDPTAGAIVRACARRLVVRAGLRRHDVEDAEQELSIALWRALDDFDPGKGRWTTYAHVVVDRAAKGLVRKLLAAKRGPGRTVSLEALPSELREVLGAEGGPQAEARIDVALDVAEALERLSPEERALAERLQTGTVGEVAKQSGLPRSTVAGRARRLRRHLEGLGLEDSQESPASS